MTVYVLVYKGGGMLESEEERAAVLAQWGAWYGGMGEAVVDGGNPFGASATIAPDGTVSQGAASGLSGYTVLKTDSLDAASQMAKGCPIVSSGGTVEVYETFSVM